MHPLATCLDFSHSSRYQSMQNTQNTFSVSPLRQTSRGFNVLCKGSHGGRATACEILRGRITNTILSQEPLKVNTHCHPSCHDYNHNWQSIIQCTDCVDGQNSAVDMVNIPLFAVL